MNPFYSDQRHIRSIIEHALNKCVMQQANTEFLIQVKSELLRVTRQARTTLSDEFFNQPLVLNDGEIIIPSPRQIFEMEEQHHQTELDLQVELLKQLQEAEQFIDNMLRRHRQNYDTKYHTFIQRQRQKRSKNNSAASSSHG